MNHTAGEGNVDLTETFACLASSDSRHLLGVLSDEAPTSVTQSALATSLAARRQDKPRDRVTDEERQESLAALLHVHLPKLDDAGLIEWDGDAVAVTDHVAYEDPGVREVIHGEATGSPESLDALFDALAARRRRTVLDVLSHEYQSIQVATLAREVTARERGTSHRDVTSDDVHEVRTALHHAHLPKLRDAGLIERDGGEQTVAYEGHPDLRVPWMHSRLGTDFRARLTDSPTDADVWNLEGRERVVSCGQSLCEEAEEELFLMFTTTGLLEAGCLTRIKQAADRGVDISLGTCDPVVEAFVREHAPEVSLWEPETNWLDLPVEGEKVGRLVFADREAVMVGTLGESDDDGVHEEQAVFGEGTDNVLVVLLRQMLGSRLDQSDEPEIDSSLML